MLACALTLWTEWSHIQSQLRISELKHSAHCRRILGGGGAQGRGVRKAHFMMVDASGAHTHTQSKQQIARHEARSLSNRCVGPWSCKTWMVNAIVPMTGGSMAEQRHSVCTCHGVATLELRPFSCLPCVLYILRESCWNQ